MIDRPEVFTNTATIMNLRPLISGLVYSILIFPASATSSLASGCLTGGCHLDLTKMKHMHGPIGAELAGVQGCIMCHIPAGSTCTPSGPGKFTIKTEDICHTCHVKGSGSQHENASNNCLKCHNPHGSNTSPYMLRPKS